MQKKIIMLILSNFLIIVFYFLMISKNKQSDFERTSSGVPWYFNFQILEKSKDDSVPVVVSQFRGDAARTGRYTISLHKINPKLVWKVESINAEIHSASKSTPAVDETGVYLGSDTGVLYAYDLNGNVRWTFKTDSDVRGIHGTALLDQLNLYIGSYNGFFYSINKQTGNINWISKLGNAVGSSATMQGENLIISGEFDRPREGHLVAISAKTGKLVWKSEFFGEQIHSSPSYSEQNNSFGLGSNNGVFWAIDANDGRTLWSERLGEPIKSTAAFFDNKFCFTSWQKKLICLDSISGEVTNEVSFEAKSQSSPALLGKEFIVVSSTDGGLYKISHSETSDVKKVSLKSDKDSSNYGMPSPIVINAKNETRIVSACYATAICFFDSELNLKSKIDVGGLVNGSFTVFGNSLYGSAITGGCFRVDF